MIRPSIWLDGKFASLSIGAGLVFIGMISQADDEGFVAGNIDSLRVGILGPREVTTEQMQEWVDEICVTKMVRRIIVDASDLFDGTVYYFPNWRKHQTINRPAKSFIGKRIEDLGISLDGAPPARAQEATRKQHGSNTEFATGAQGAVSVETPATPQPGPDNGPTRKPGKRAGLLEAGPKDPGLYAKMLREDVGAICDLWAERFGAIRQEKYRAITPGMANKIAMWCRDRDWSPVDLLGLVPVITRKSPTGYLSQLMKKTNPPERPRPVRESSWSTWVARPGRKHKPSKQATASVAAMVASIGRDV
jgi:hypothetical protein